MKMTESQKKMIEYGIAVLAVVGILALVLSQQKPAAETEVAKDAEVTEVEEVAPATEEPVVEAPAEVVAPAPATTPAPAPVVKPKTLSYDDAVEKYGGFRFQFVNCHGTPGSMIIKKGSTIMLDNRDAVTRTIKVGTATYTIPKYDFKLATITQTGTLNITCNGGGAATLTVEL